MDQHKMKNIINDNEALEELFLEANQLLMECKKKIILKIEKIKELSDQIEVLIKEKAEWEAKINEHYPCHGTYDI